MVNFDVFIGRKNVVSALAATALVAGVSVSYGQNILDPKPLIRQQMTQQYSAQAADQDSAQVASSNAVDGINFSYGIVGGILDGKSNGMGLISLTAPIPYFSSFGIQGDLAYGIYDGNNASSSAAAALHIFWRNPGVGMLGIYGDWGYLSPVHSGRLGIEAAHYSGQWSIDGLFAMEFGQNVYTKFVDEIDVSYYVDNNTKISLGHRFTARGNVANIGFEKQFGELSGSAWSVFGEAEAGEDDFYQVFAGIKATLGSGTATTLIDRDRGANVRIRIPRNLASITQCADVDTPFAAPNWLTDLHLITPGSMTETLCASERSLNKVSTSGIFNP